MPRPNDTETRRRRTWSSFFAKGVAAATVVPAITVHLAAITFSCGSALQLYSEGHRLAAAAVAVCVALGTVGSAALVSMDKPPGSSATCRLLLGKRSNDFFRFCIALCGGGLVSTLDAVSTMADSVEAEMVGGEEMQRRSSRDSSRWYAASVLKTARDGAWKDWAAFLDPPAFSQYRAVREAVFGHDGGRDHSLFARGKEALFRAQATALGLFSAWCPQHCLAVKGFYANAVAAIPCALLLSFFLCGANQTANHSDAFTQSSEGKGVWYSFLITAMTKVAVSLFPTVSPSSAIHSAAVVANAASVVVAAAPLAAGLMTSSVAAALLSAVLPILDVSAAVYGLATLSVAMQAIQPPWSFPTSAHRVSGSGPSASVFELGMPSPVSIALVIRFGILCAAVLIPSLTGACFAAIEVCRQIKRRRFTGPQFFLTGLGLLAVPVVAGPVLCGAYIAGVTLPLFMLVDRTASLNPVLFMHLCTFGRLSKCQRKQQSTAASISNSAQETAEGDTQRRHKAQSAESAPVLWALLFAVRSVATATKEHTPEAEGYPSSRRQERDCSASRDRCFHIQRFTDIALIPMKPDHNGGNIQQEARVAVDPSLVTASTPAFVQALQLTFRLRTCASNKHTGTSLSEIGRGIYRRSSLTLLNRAVAVGGCFYAVSQAVGLLLPGFCLLLSVGNSNTSDLTIPSLSHGTFVQRAMLTAWTASALTAALCAPFAWRSVALACMVRRAAPSAYAPPPAMRLILDPSVQAASVAELVLPRSSDVIRSSLSHDVVPKLLTQYVVLPFVPQHCVSFDDMPLSECCA